MSFSPAPTPPRHPPRQPLSVDPVALAPSATTVRPIGPLPSAGPPRPGQPGRRGALSPVHLQRPAVVLTPEERALALRLRHQRIELARRDGAAFNEFVLRREDNGARVKNGPHHVAWHDILDRHNRVVLWSAVEHAKTAQISIGRALYELGRNPNLRIAIVSETDAKAKKILRAIKGYLRESKELHALFPNLKRSSRRDEPWNAHAITVERDTYSAKDPSIQVVGVRGSIVGSRVDILILDDVLSQRTALKATQRDELLAWYNSNCAGRLTEYARVWCVGTAWHREDLMHHLSKTEGWFHKRFPVIDPETGLPTWPEAWSLERIAFTRGQLGPIEAARQLDCQGWDSTTNVFHEEWLTRCLRLGDGFYIQHSLAEMLGEGESLPEGAFCVTGVDVGASLRKTAALTVLATLLVYPDGLRQILCIEAGRFTGPQIVQRCRDHHARYQSLVFVEDNGAQKFLLDFAEGQPFPVLPHHTGANKNDPVFGVQSIAVEMFKGRWMIPNDAGVTDAEVAALLADMREYSPDKHTPDRLAALWIAREGARKIAPQAIGAGNVGVRIFAPVDAPKGRRDWTDPIDYSEDGEG